MINYQYFKQQNFQGIISNDTKLSIETIINLIDQPTSEILRDHHRSLVVRKNTENGDFVLKKPHNKNRSPWIRFTTLYRDSEVVRDFKSQYLLATLNIPTVKPVAALEKRRMGMVVDSYIIYQYRHGELVTEEHFKDMINIMHKLHHQGYLHDDPHIKNFLVDDNTVFAIDCKPRKNRLGKLAIVHNMTLLALRYTKPDTIYPLLDVEFTKSWQFKLCLRWIALQNQRRRLKNSLRKLLGLKRKKI